MNADAIGEAGAGLIARLGAGRRASLATVLHDTGYFAVTPEAPYDGRIGTAEQTRQLLRKAEQRLHRIGSGKDRLAFVAIILADMADYQAMNDVWDEWVDGIEPPARVCFEARLASPDLKVEMIVVCSTAA